MSSLHVDNIKYSYRSVKALRGVSLTVEPGRFVALLGANGAGKTTLFSIVTGLYRAHSGGVSVMGHSIDKDTLKALSAIGVVFQRSTLDTDLTVLQNLRYASELQGMKRRTGTERINNAIAMHNMENYAKRKVSTLSGGQKRRVELARALLHKPSVLLLDEPTVGLDLSSRNDFVSHVKSLCKSENTGVLWATHLMEEVNNNDDIYIMHKGLIAANGIASDLLKQHNTRHVADLFNTVIAQQQP